MSICSEQLLLPIAVSKMDLKLTQIIASGMLAMGKKTLHELFSPIFHLQKWQQAPVAALMQEFAPMMKMMVEATCLRPTRK